MDVINKTKWLWYGIYLEFVIVSAYCNAKLWLQHPNVMGVAAVTFCVCMAVSFFYKRRKNRKAPKWWIFYKWTEVMIKGLVCFLLMIDLMYAASIGIPILKRKSTEGRITMSQAEEIAVRNRGKSILEQADLLQQISPEVYSELSLQGKLNALYHVVQIEAEYLGIEAPALKCMNLQRTTIGMYMDEEGMIVLNELYMPYEETILEGLLHEMYHAYQYECMAQVEEEKELLFFRQVKVWQKEAEQYSGAEEGYMEYYLQEMESSARKYSEDRIKEYGKLIVLGR